MQKINLYAALPKEDAILFSAKQHLIINLVFFSLLMVVFSLGVYHQSAIRNEWNAYQAEEISAAKALERVAAEYPDIAQNTALENKVSTMVEAIAEKKALLQELRGATEHQGFSVYLTALARVTPANVWLESIVIKPADRTIELSGRTNNATVLPKFMEKLNQESVFQNTPFSALKVDQPDPAKNTIHFVLGTHERKAA